MKNKKLKYWHPTIIEERRTSAVRIIKRWIPNAMKKKFSGLILALVMAFSLALPVYAAEGSETAEPTEAVEEVEEVQEVADTVAPSQAEDAAEAADSSEAATEAASAETTAPAEAETAARSGMSPTMIFCLVLIVFGLLIVTQSKNLSKIGKKMKKNKEKK